MLSFRTRMSILFVLSCASVASAQRDLTNIPTPDPAEEAGAMRLDPRIEVNLFAADPMIKKPIQMNFDSDGRLWVASSEVYPQIEPGAKPIDKIIVLEDTTGDGVADSHRVFADNLLIPTGVLPGDGGVYVANSTELLHLKDTDGDGKADQSRVVLSGFGTEDTHHLLHTLRWGPDGCLYMNQSIYIHSHVETPYGTRHLNGGGIWRYRPETQRLDVLCKGFVNPWGHIFDAYGQSFATDGAYFEGINYVFPGAIFVTSPGASRHLRGLNPGSPKHCGLEILSGTHIPADWIGDLVTNDFRSHRVCRFTVRPQDSGYASRQQPELITTDHVAFRPIDVRMGPDGAIYVADWYNPIIQHGEVDFRDERRDRTHGRIWRLTFKDSPLMPRTMVSQLPETALLDLLESPALFLRQFARQELKHRDSQKTLQLLSQWIAAASDQARQNRQFEAMWVRECLDHPDGDLLRTLASCEVPQFRAGAVRTIGRRISQVSNAGELLRKAAVDAHPQVRLEAVSALAQVGTVEAISDALAALDHPLDDNLDFALWNTLHTSRELWTKALAAGTFDWGNRLGRLEFAVRSAQTAELVPSIVAMIDDGRVNPKQATSLIIALAESADTAGLELLLRLVLDPSRPIGDGDRAVVLRSIVQQQQQRNMRPASSSSIVGEYISKDKPAPGSPMSDVLVTAIGQWKLQDLESFLVRSMEASGSDRLPAAELSALGMLATESALKRLAGIARNQDQPMATRIAAIESMSGPRPRQAVGEGLRLIASREAAPWGEQSLRILLRRKDGAALLQSGLENVALPSDAARAVLRESRAVGTHKELEEAIRKAGQLDDSGWKMSTALTQSIVEEVRTIGDPVKGELVYRRENLQCVKCHAIGPAGGRVGPNLVSIGGSAQIDYLIESLIDPNAKIKENFHSMVVVTFDGSVTQGIRDVETDQSLTLRLADGSKKTIAKDAIDQVGEGRSLMASGLIDSLTRQELVHLVCFLSELGRTEAYKLSTAPMVRSWQKLMYSPEANRILNRTSVDSAASENPVFVWQSVTSLVDGTLPLNELPKFQQHRTTPPTSFVRFDFETFDQQPLRLHLPETTGLEMWIDGKPTPPSMAMELKLAKGKHRLTLAIDRESVSVPFQVRFDDQATAQVIDGD